MTVRKLRFLVLLVCMFGILGSVGTASGQTLVVTAKSLSDLSDDFEYLIKTVAPEGDPTAQTILDGLNQFKSGAIVKGLDRSRGFGLAITLPKDFPQGGGTPSIVAAVPVTDLGQFLDSLKELGVAVDDQPGVAGFSHKVTAPNGNPTLFVLQSKGYALFSLVPDQVDKLKALDPSSWKPKGRPDSSLSVRIRIAEIPDALKDQFLNQVEAGINQQNDRQPGEDDARFRGRIAGQNLGMDGVKSLIRDGDEVAMDLDLNRKTSEIALEISLSAKPGTGMAKTLRDLNSRQSRFQALDKDAALAAWATLPVAKEIREMFSAVIDKGLKDGSNNVNSDEEKKLYTRFGELIKSTLTAPDIDLGIAIQKPSSKGQFVIVGGMSLQNGREFERLVRDTAAKIKEGENVKWAFDVAKAADGTAIHKLTGPLGPKEEDLIKRFGKGTLFFAFRQDALLATFGEAGLEPLQRALERFSGPAASGSGGPIAVVVHVASLGELAEKDEETFRKAISDVFRGQGEKRDRISYGLKGEGDAIRLRVALDVPALKALALIGNRTKP